MNFIRNIKIGIHDAFSPVLSDRTILKYINKGLLIDQRKHPVTENQIQPNSVDLTLAPIGMMLNSNSIVPDKYDPAICHAGIDPSIEVKYSPIPFREKGNQRSIVLKPKQFMLMSSREVLDIPNGIIAFVQGRSSIARMGIQTEQAGLIDTGFCGTITFEVFNQTEYPITLYAGMRVAQVYFYRAQYAKTIYGRLGMGSKYQHQIDATGSRINEDPELRRIAGKE